MPLNLPRRSNGPTKTEFVSALRYIARADTWSTWHDGFHYSVDLNPGEVRGVFDLEDIFTGWIRLSAGETPTFLWDVDGKQQQRPDKSYRRGFSVHLILENYGLRELCGNTGGLCQAIAIAYDQYERAPEAAQGLLPILQTGPSEKVDSPNGVYWEPSFFLVGWAPRPPELKRRPPSASVQPAAAPATTPALIGPTLPDDSIPF